MSSPAFPNIYTHRKVADTSARACDICYKPSTSVLVTPETKDFFYICPGHLKDAGFCTPIVDEAAVAARKKKKEMDDEVRRVKEEYDEKQKKKKEKEEKEKEKGKEKEKDKKGDKEKDEQEKKDSEEKKTDQEKNTGTSTSSPEEEPRVFALKINFYRNRLNKKRNAELAKQNAERLRNPNFWPSVPQEEPMSKSSASAPPPA